jgi:NADPH-dependent 2,4-dienoyl-CoA reductase/sulfur reductase-like enzyme
MSTTFPMQRPVPVTGAVAQMFRDALAERGVEEFPQCLVTSIDPIARTAQLASGETLPYDLFVGIPVHRAPDVLAASGLTVNGWVPVDQDNIRTQFPGVYALGRNRCRHLGRGASGAVRRIRRLLRRVRRRTRQQGRDQLPQGRAARGPAVRSVARVRPREGTVRRDPARTLVRPLTNATLTQTVLAGAELPPRYRC